MYNLAKVDPKKGMRLTGHKTFTVYEDYNTIVEGDVADVLARLQRSKMGRQKSKKLIYKVSFKVSRPKPALFAKPSFRCKPVIA